MKRKNEKKIAAAQRHPRLTRFWHGFRVWWRRWELSRWLILILMTAFLSLSAFYTIKAKVADVESLKASLKQTRPTVYDRDGKVAGTLYSQKGTFVELSAISKNVQNAVIATEDRSFYRNPGFSVKGIARSAFNYVIHHGQIMGGGSTITQQLAKNMLLSQKQTLGRKLEEIYLAVEINRVYSKTDILTMYLNNAYFGNGVWGVQDASQRYFGRNASELTVAQGATLAGILRNPTFYDPVKQKENMIGRRDLILRLETETAFITTAQADQAKQEALTITNTYQRSNGYQYPYYFDAVISEAINDYGISETDVLNKGYKIYTSLDQDYQKQMQASYDQAWVFPANAADGTLAQSGSIALDPQTGGVVAVVGRRGEHVFRSYNYATMAKRQPGSTIKPLAVYAPALANGYHYDSSLVDKDMTFGSNKYHPTNADNRYLGQVPMYEALAQSRNVPAVWLLDQIGVNKGVSSVENFGIKVAKNDQNLALALGGLSSGVSPLQMAQAYTAFANQGKMTTAHFITKIVDATGAVIVDNTKTKSRTVMSASNAKVMTSMLLGVFNTGTGQNAKPDGYAVAGKTGSTEVPKSYGYGTKDQWIVGYTPDLVVATWVGFDKTDQNHFLQGTSSQGVAPIFKLEMSKMLAYSPKTSFGTEDASSIAKEKQDNTTGAADWFSDLQGGLNDTWEKAKDGLGNAKNNLDQWYNNVKGLFGQ
ncbi:PBP1A family penicillin-binding protein [Lapidilactobacillus luobeiensis]|uniref:PBP1A family penicillin-binding protein n=1 Tax=Lapidilactobacillus luobeiensis TaxID=2950371 RepID=UPI0021C3DCE3|nr:PBP1A family penicillin-binding protein [Lapidilactobacillus luobeiensis]